MSKDEAMGRLIRVAEHCDEQTILKLCNVLETTLEPGPYDVCSIEELCLTAAETANDPAADQGRAVRESAWQMAISGL